MFTEQPHAAFPPTIPTTHSRPLKVVCLENGDTAGSHQALISEMECTAFLCAVKQISQICDLLQRTHNPLSAINKAYVILD